MKLLQVLLPVFFQVHGDDDKGPVRVDGVRVHVRGRFTKIGIELIGLKQLPVLDDVQGNVTDVIQHDADMLDAIESFEHNEVCAVPFDHPHSKLALAGLGRTDNHEERVAKKQWLLEGRESMVNQGGVLLLEVVTNRDIDRVGRGTAPSTGT